MMGPRKKFMPPEKQGRKRGTGPLRRSINRVREIGIRRQVKQRLIEHTEKGPGSSAALGELTGLWTVELPEIKPELGVVVTEFENAFARGQRTPEEINRLVNEYSKKIADLIVEASGKGRGT